MALVRLMRIFHTKLRSKSKSTFFFAEVRLVFASLFQFNLQVVLKVLNINLDFINRSTEGFLFIDLKAVNAQKIGKRFENSAVQLIEQNFELIFLMVVDFFDHDFRYFGAFVHEDFDAAKYIILTFLCEYIVVGKHLVELLLTLLH